MSQTRRSIAQGIVDHLAAAERSTDRALIDTAELAAAMLRARLDLDAAAVFGQEAFDHVASTFAAHAESRRQIVAAHNALAEVKLKMGLGPVSLGGLGSKDTSALTTSPTLTLVDTIAA